MSDQEQAPAVEPAVAIPGGQLAGQAELDATFARAFAEVEPDEQGEEADGPVAVRDEEGKFTSRAAAGVPKIGEFEEDEAPADEAEPEKPAEDDEAYERALLSLRYAHGKAAEKVIKNSSRDELIALGAEAADRRAKTEAALEERAVRIRELEGQTKAPAAQAKPAADWTPHLKALAEQHGLDPEAASKAYVPLLDAVVSTMRAEFEGRLAPMEKVAQEQLASEGRRQISEQVQRLSAEYPKLKTDQDLVLKLNGKALALWKSGEYHDARSVYDDAERLVLAGHIPTAGLATKRRNGSAPPPEGRVHDAMETSDEALLTAMERSEAGDSRGARRAGSQFWEQEMSKRQRK